MIMFPRHTPIAALLTSLLLVACSQGEGEAPPAPAANDGGAWVEAWRNQGPAMMFMRSRVGELIERRLPEAIAKKELNQARKFCDLGDDMITRMRERWGESEMDAGSVTLFESFREACAVDVAGAVLDDLIASLEGASEEDLTTMCPAGNRELGFSIEHPSSAPSIVEKRNTIFAKCPDLKANFEMFERKRPATP